MTIILKASFLDLHLIKCWQVFLHFFLEKLNWRKSYINTTSLCQFSIYFFLSTKISHNGWTCSCLETPVKLEPKNLTKKMFMTFIMTWCIFHYLLLGSIHLGCILRYNMAATINDGCSNTEKKENATAL